MKFKVKLSILKNSTVLEINSHRNKKRWELILYRGMNKFFKRIIGIKRIYARDIHGRRVKN